MDEKRRGNRSHDAMHELSDDHFVEQLASGSKAEKDAATAELYRRYHRIIFGIIRARLSDAQRAEEVAQEVIFETLQKIGNYQRGSASSFSNWIKAIARSRAIDAHRSEHGRHTKRKTIHIDGMEEWEKERLLHEHTGDGEMKEKSHASLARAVAMLPERLRKVVELTLAGKKMKEIGSMLGVVESRVSQLLAEAREHLRKRMLREEQPSIAPEPRQWRRETPPEQSLSEPSRDVLAELLGYIDEQLAGAAQERVAAEKRVAAIRKKLEDEAG